MKKSVKLVAGIFTASVLFTGCGSSSDGGSASAIPNGGNDLVAAGEAQPIETLDQAKEAAQGLSSISSLQGFIPGSGAGGSYMAVQRASTLATSNVKKANAQSIGCTYGGSIDIEANSQTSMVQTYNSCEIAQDVVINGKVNVNNIKQNSDGSVSSTMSFQNYSITGKDFKASLDMTIDSQTSYDSNYNAKISMTYNGSVSMDMYGYSASYKYANFHSTVSITSSKVETTLDGLISMDSPCYKGVLDIKTLQPLTTNYANYSSIQGELKVNGADYLYNGDGTVTVTTTSGESSTFDQYELAQSCSK